MDTISFFCLDSDELYLRRLMLKDKSVSIHARSSRGALVALQRALHGGFLPLLQPLPVLLQGADGVPRLAARPPQWAVGQDAFRVRFFGAERRRRGGRNDLLFIIIYIYYI